MVHSTWMQIISLAKSDWILHFAHTHTHTHTHSMQTHIQVHASAHTTHPHSPGQLHCSVAVLHLLTWCSFRCYLWQTAGHPPLLCKSKHVLCTLKCTGTSLCIASFYPGAWEWPSNEHTGPFTERRRTKLHNLDEAWDVILRHNNEDNAFCVSSLPLQPETHIHTHLHITTCVHTRKHTHTS